MMNLPIVFGVAAVSVVTAWMFPFLQILQTQQNGSPQGGSCEGYWPDTHTCLELGMARPPWLQRPTVENAGCPQWRIHPDWSGRDVFLERLQEIEGLAKEWESTLADMTGEHIKSCGGLEGVTPPVYISRMRGVAWSRMEPNFMAGNSEYRSSSSKNNNNQNQNQQTGDYPCWTDVLREMYVDKFHVKPTRAFRKFVASYDIPDFRRQLEEFQSCATVAAASASSTAEEGAKETD